ncbi:MAG: 6-phosphogluconolactonase [Pseudomonadota bacterium]
MPSDDPREVRWHVARNPADWLARALDHVHRAERQALAERGVFHLVLAGGNTPGPLYQALAAGDHAWPRWHLWFGDERCLPAEHPERNSVMAGQRGVDRLAAAGARVHAIGAEAGPEAAARAYAGELSGLGPFDLVLLGLGQDGHTASLFPGLEWGTGEDAPDVLPVRGAPKPPPQRVSLSARRLARSRTVLFLVAGADKQDALARWRRGEALPAAAIRPAGGVDVLMDADAGPPGEAT